VTMGLTFACFSRHGSAELAFENQYCLPPLNWRLYLSVNSELDCRSIGVCPACNNKRHFVTNADLTVKWRHEHWDTPSYHDNHAVSADTEDILRPTLLHSNQNALMAHHTRRASKMLLQPIAQPQRSTISRMSMATHFMNNQILLNSH
jgi:hypothetical protein